MENALYDFHSLVDTYQKTHSFAALTRSFSDTTQLVNKNRTRAFSIFYLQCYKTFRCDKIVQFKSFRFLHFFHLNYICFSDF